MKRITLLAGLYPAHPSQEKHPPSRNQLVHLFQETFIRDILGKGLSALDKWATFLSGKRRPTQHPLCGKLFLGKILVVHQQAIPLKSPDKPPLIRS